MTPYCYPDGLHSYFYCFCTAQPGYGHINFFAGYGMILSQNIISSYCICIVDHGIYNVDATLFSISFLCINVRYFF